MQSTLPRALALMTGLFAAANVHAQTYPFKQVRIIVGFVPGGGSDFIARLISANWNSCRSIMAATAEGHAAGHAV